MLAADPEDPFTLDFLAFQRRVARFGALNSLAQTLLKLAARGVPEIYQGCELWDFSLVDPDNRRPVDCAGRAALLDRIRFEAAASGGDLPRLAGRWLDAYPDGRVKLCLTQRGLDLRRRPPGLFRTGGYHPLAARGQRSAHVCAFARASRDEVVIAVAPRLVVRLTGGEERWPLGESTWGDTWLALPPEWAGLRLRSALTGRTLPVGRRDGGPALPLAAALADLPIALLESPA